MYDSCAIEKPPHRPHHLATTARPLRSDAVERSHHVTTTAQYYIFYSKSVRVDEWISKEHFDSIVRAVDI